MTDEKKNPPRPAFRPVQAATTYKTPEELFNKLTGRAKTHGYLRGPQQDVLREYAEKPATVSDVAFELPTGTGKTGVGLLIAEWRRLAGKRVAYLSLTNQLAVQVLAEGQRLGLPCADLRGTNKTRDPVQEGRFKTRAAIGVTTYSNLFNENPVVQECDLLVLDDAHGAEHYVADMWTVSVEKATDSGVFNSLLADLHYGMTESQIRAVLDPSGFRTVEMVDVIGHSECMTAATATLDKTTVDHIRYPWRRIRNRLPACLFLVSASEITIRPLIPPTHTHAPFWGAGQRIYMSATLSGESDLRRAYGIENLRMIRAKSSQWGRRYVFVPGIYTKEQQANQVVGAVWDAMAPRRAVLLAPSEKVMNRCYNAITGSMSNKPVRFRASDIENSVEDFVKHDSAILTLARYDGLDLPDEQCRLLVMAESPAATNALERHLSERWKLGPVLRKRERTRLIQGMGRCTRSATDFAVTIWLGQSLVNAATSQALLSGMPSELACEIKWGLKQAEMAGKKPDELVGMIAGLLSDPDYRKAANDQISALEAEQTEGQPEEYEKLGPLEVRFAKAMWDEDYGSAFEAARSIADHVTAPELAGYRAWWWYLASLAASLRKDTAAERDALNRGSHCGINSGWIRLLLTDRTGAAAATDTGDLEPSAESIWDLFEHWGWAGPRFAEKIEKMMAQLSQQYHVGYHEGLEALGRCLGAQTTRLTEAGAPDVVWSFLSADTHLAFEAKTEKKGDGSLSKKDLQEAKGHVDWVRTRICEGRTSAVIEPVVVSPDATVHQIGLPFTEGIYHISPERILKLADRVAECVVQLRIKFSGREFAAAAKDLSIEIRAAKMDLKSLTALLTETPLKK